MIFLFLSIMNDVIPHTASSCLKGCCGQLYMMITQTFMHVNELKFIEDFGG